MGIVTEKDTIQFNTTAPSTCQFTPLALRLEI